jgi:hypothetical protein
VGTVFRSESAAADDEQDDISSSVGGCLRARGEIADGGPISDFGQQMSGFYAVLIQPEVATK